MLRGLYGPLPSIKSRELLSHYVFEAMQDELCVDVRSLHLLPAVLQLPGSLPYTALLRRLWNALGLGPTPAFSVT
jgi:hypothetical protein